MTNADVLPSYTRYTIVPNESHTRYSIVRPDGSVERDPAEGLPLDSIKTRAAAERIAQRLNAF